MEKRTIVDLELEIRTCSHMVFNLEKLEKPFIITLGSKDDKTDVGNIHFQTKETLGSEGDVICDLTKKTCVLYSNYSGESLHNWPHIRYGERDKCPSFEESSIKYKVNGVKESIYLDVSHIWTY